MAKVDIRAQRSAAQVAANSTNAVIWPFRASASSSGSRAIQTLADIGQAASGLVATGYRYWQVVCETNRGDIFNIVVGEIEMRISSGGADQTAGKTVTATSTEGANVAANLVDNNTATYWKSADNSSFQQSLTVDFTTAISITEVVISMPSLSNVGFSAPSFVRVRYSDDGVTWIESFKGVYIGWATNGNDSWTLTKAANTDATAYRYWRVYVASTTNSTNVAVGELELRLTTGGADQTGSGTASASSIFDGSYVASNAVDNNTATGWISQNGAGGYNQWWQYDFGSGQDKVINEMTMRELGGFVNNIPRHGFIAASADGSTWVAEWDFHFGTWSAAETKTSTRP